MDKEHEIKMEEMKLQNEQEIFKKEKELSNSAMYSSMQGSFGNIMETMLSTPEMKQEISEQIKKSLQSKKA